MRALFFSSILTSAFFTILAAPLWVSARADMATVPLHCLVSPGVTLTVISALGAHTRNSSPAAISALNSTPRDATEFPEHPARSSTHIVRQAHIIFISRSPNLGLRNLRVLFVSRYCRLAPLQWTLSLRMLRRNPSQLRVKPHRIFDRIVARCEARYAVAPLDRIPVS